MHKSAIAPALRRSRLKRIIVIEPGQHHLLAAPPMFAHRFRRAFEIARVNGVDDDGVLVVRSPNVGHAALNGAIETVRGGFVTCEHVKEPPVRATTAKRCVECPVRGRGLGGRGGLELVVKIAEHRDIRPKRFSRCLDGERFEGAEDRIELSHYLRVRRRNHKALVRARDDQTFLFEAEKRFAKRGSADPKFVGQCDLFQMLGALEFATNNPLADQIADLIAHPADEDKLGTHVFCIHNRFKRCKGEFWVTEDYALSERREVAAIERLDLR